MASRNRYAVLLTAAELEEYQQTFATYDADGGGDLEVKEIGVAMRQLGGRPTDADIRKMIAEVDEDESGTVDFEEFCALMLRQARSASAPSYSGST